MKSSRGFTLIELAIFLLIVGIIAVFVIGSFSGLKTDSISFGFTGLSETRCIENYKFVVGEGGQARQIMDENGKGIRCD